jgi:asparagine synthase (glutamine-hydrolysing)
MCGIAGVFPLRGAAPAPVEELLARMLEAQRHRGPDDRGIWLLPGGEGGIGNCRLAIRDLSPAGHLPMGSEDGLVWITYNGELYNAQELRSELEPGRTFRSSSDTEVVLAGYERWGAGVLPRLRGIFGLGIVDLHEGTPRLLLARDPLGVKPLYYAEGPHGFAFASELKALRAAGYGDRGVCAEALTAYLMLGAVPNPMTMYRDVRALPPGSWMEVSDGAIGSPVRYWRFPEAVRNDGEDLLGGLGSPGDGLSARQDSSETGSAPQAVARVREALVDAVRAQLVSDVPLGAFLSGGVDSSAVVALMRLATGGTIRTCSIVFAEAEYSEDAYARAMAAAAGTEHFEWVVTASQVESELERVLSAMDQPTVDGVNTYFVAQTARQAGLTVALSGLGGDELFGGYDATFRGVPRLRRSLGMLAPVPGGRRMASAALGLSPRRRAWARASDALARPPSAASAYLARRGVFGEGEIARLVSPDLRTTCFDAVAHVGAIAGTEKTFAVRPFSWVSRAELGVYTHHQLLRDTDVMSMAHSLEVRVPLLDVRLVELVLSLPDTVKAGWLQPKGLLLAALGDDLPASITAPRPKQGFVFPFDRWLRGPLRGPAEELLDAAGRTGWLDAGEVRHVWELFLAGRVHWSRPWTLAVLGGAT